MGLPSRMQWKNRRMARMLPDVDLVCPGPGMHQGFPLSLCEFRLPQVETSGDAHFVQRSLIRLPSRFLIRRAHDERPRLDPHHIHRGSAGKLCGDLRILGANLGRGQQTEAQTMLKCAAHQPRPTGPAIRTGDRRPGRSCRSKSSVRCKNRPQLASRSERASFSLYCHTKRCTFFQF